MEYSIQTKKYEGPMELLLDLIKRNKIDISDISIVEITEQYVDYVDNMGKLDLDFASDFIDMAARLLEIKSRYILYLKYNSSEEEDPRKELVQKIEEYKKFREITENLRDSIKEYDDRFYREKEEYLEEEELDLSVISIDEIAKIALKIFKKIDENKDTEEILKKNEKLKNIVRNKNISVESRIESIRDRIKLKKKIRFSEILESKEKKEVIANFLAILELIKMKEIIIQQEDVYQEIIIKRIESEEEIIIQDKYDKEYEKIEKKASRRMEKKIKKVDNDND